MRVLKVSHIKQPTTTKNKKRLINFDKIYEHEKGEKFSSKKGTLNSFLLLKWVKGKRSFVK